MLTAESLECLLPLVALASAFDLTYIAEAASGVVPLKLCSALLADVIMAYAVQTLNAHDTWAKDHTDACGMLGRLRYPISSEGQGASAGRSPIAC